jgi:hypothetical protein
MSLLRKYQNIISISISIRPSLVDAASSSVACSVATSAGGGAMVPLGSGATAVLEVSGGCRDVTRISALLRATVWRMVVARVAFTVTRRLDAAVQRCPPQHRMILIRTGFTGYQNMPQVSKSFISVELVSFVANFF